MLPHYPPQAEVGIWHKKFAHYGAFDIMSITPLYGALDNFLKKSSLHQIPTQVPHRTWGLRGDVKR